MHIFLTGATGYIGAAVLDALIKGGHKVTAMARDKEKAERLAAKGATPIVAELGLPKRYLAAVKAADAVVYCAYESSPRGVALEKQTLESMLATQAQASQADGKVRTFIYTSGVWVLGRAIKAADESAPLDPPPHVAWRLGTKTSCCRRSRRHSAPWWCGRASFMAAAAASWLI
jgi:uncharacterized protein YbjT (DUF2867 family)